MNAPIGVFDSGVGGLTVMKEIMRQLPGGKPRVFWRYCAGTLWEQVKKYGVPVQQADRTVS